MMVQKLLLPVLLVCNGATWICASDDNNNHVPSMPTIFQSDYKINTNDYSNISCVEGGEIKIDVISVSKWTIEKENGVYRLVCLLNNEKMNVFCSAAINIPIGFYTPPVEKGDGVYMSQIIEGAEFYRIVILANYLGGTSVVYYWHKIQDHGQHSSPHSSQGNSVSEKPPESGGENR